MITDANVTLSRWPFRRLIGDEPADLVAQLQKQKVSQAWVGTFEGIFHKDIAGANARLVRDCDAYGPGFLLPFGSINPSLPDWQEDVRRCDQEHQMRGIRLHPNYHGYKLADPAFAELLKLAAARGLIVQLALCMEDERTQHPLIRVAPVDLGPLADLVEAEPKLQLVLLNCYPQLQWDQVTKLASNHNVYFEISMVERAGGVAHLIKRVGLERVFFGSHYPLFYFESALLKVREAGLSREEERALFEGNAQRLIMQPTKAGNER
ncbi:MAG TPA: amidohydrolase family protein [Terriglobia bacterium]|nr:amidohydrolase family protein [Terriglobia bacterium]